MVKTLRSRILLYFLVVSLCGILLTSLSILWGFEDHFINYLRENRERNISLIEDDLKREYKESQNLISNQILGLMHEQAMTENLFYKIYDKRGKMIADTTMMFEMMGNMKGQKESQVDSEYKSYYHDLIIEKQLIGRVKVYYPNNLLGEDFSFLHTVKQNIILVAIITLIISFIFSVLISKKLSIGFNRLSRAVNELQTHKWKTRVSVEELPEELVSLGTSFNELAVSLAKEEDLRKQFTADLAHELRTPLSTLRSQIEAYQDGIWEPTPLRLQQSHDELMRLVRLVNELEKLLAAENPQIKLQKTEIEATNLISFINAQFEPAFREKGVKLIVENTEKSFWFNADYDRVIQILTNIINNALKYTQAEKQVKISIIEKNDFIGFSVKDEGIGISQEDLPFLFERFYRGDKSRDRKTGGIGIGLSIVKALIDAHGGKIMINSKVNVGTNVTVFFPKK